MVEESSIAAEDTASGSDPLYKVYRSSFEKEMDIPVWDHWEVHFLPVVKPTSEKAELHLKHPFQSSKAGYDRVKLVKVATLPDEKFKHYKETIRKTRRDAEEVEAYTRYHEESKYFSFSLERLIDMIEYLVGEGFSVSLTGNVIDSYQEKCTNG